MLKWAIERGHAGIITDLMNKKVEISQTNMELAFEKASPNTNILRIIVSARDSYGRDKLMQFVVNQEVEMVKKFK